MQLSSGCGDSAICHHRLLLTHCCLLPLSPTTIPQNLRGVIEDCWTADPESRPSFEDVVNRLEDMLKDMPKHSPYSKGNDGCQCSLS